MRKNIFALFLIVALSLFAFRFFAPSEGKPIAEREPTLTKKILLVPLDSRPPCRQAVIDAALIDNKEIITPPSELLDYYYESGDTKKLQAWLKENFTKADYAIISVDQLLHGGLIASREGAKTDADRKEVISLFRTLHEKAPHIPIAAFSIVPRITPPPSIGGYALWKDFIEYSRLTDELSQKTDATKKARLDELKSTLPKEDLARYEELFDANDRLNRELLSLAKNGTLELVVLGRDDGEEYGLPNLKMRELKKYLQSEKISPDKFIITHGADELALTLLARRTGREHGYMPKVFVEYNHRDTQSLIMPFMAGTVGETVEEKLKLLGAKKTLTSEEADFTLFVSCVTSDTLDTRSSTATRIKELAGKNAFPAFVDLSKKFTPEESVLPLLIKNDTTLQGLSAYAGWNTTSNSIGAATSQAVMFFAAKKDIKSKEDALHLLRANLSVLNNRYLEDFFYLKELIDEVNFHLLKSGTVYVNDLDYDKSYKLANALLGDAIKMRLSELKNSRAFNKPISLAYPGGTLKARMQSINVDTFYPWPRTFEIYLRTTLSLVELP